LRCEQEYFSFFPHVGAVGQIARVNGSPIQIVADDRERAGDVIDALKVLGGIGVTVQRLRVGDYVIEDRLIVERKTLADFAASIIDGRLFKQVAGLRAQGRRGALILEGTFDGQHMSVSREAIQGALITVSIIYGLPVLRSRDARETAQLLVFLSEQLQRSAYGAYQRPGWRPRGKEARQLFLLQSLPGVGPAKARHLIRQFGSIQAVVRASASTLATVAGIGTVTAARIRWVLD
jgi:DNA excision repair protein ERCC-4